MKKFRSILVISIIMIFVFAINVEAASIRRNDLTITENKLSEKNNEEGWEWNISDCTLTLNDVNFEFDSARQLMFDGAPTTDFTIIVNGNNTIKCGGVTGILGSELRSITIKGNGTLNIIGDCPSGITIKTTGNLILKEGVTVNITINTGSASPIHNMYGKIEIDNSTLNIDKQATSNMPIIYARQGINLVNSYIATEDAKIITVQSTNDRIGTESGKQLMKLSIIPESERAIAVGLVPNILNNKNMKEPITRLEFAAVAVKLYEKLSSNTAIVGNNPFKDTNSEDVLKAYNLGIVHGMSDNTYEPNSLITREQMAVMMTRAIEKARPQINSGLSGNYTYFKDHNEISSWALDSVYFMVEHDIIKGIGDNTFAPVSMSATREQAIAISTRSLEKFKN